MSEVQVQTQTQMDAAFRIRRAVCAISEKQPTYARCILDQFLRHIAPSMAPAKGDGFPVTCRRFATNSERAAYGTGKYPTLYFHTGNAILGFYEVAQGRVCPTLEARVVLLENIARYGMDQFHLEGDEQTGFTLAMRPIMEVKPDVSDTAGDSVGVHDTGGRTSLRRPEGLVIRSKQGNGAGLRTHADTVSGIPDTHPAV